MNENGMKMIKEIKAIIDDRCETELGQVHASSKGGKVTKTVDTSLIAKDIYNANYRKIADDEIVIKKREYEDLRLAKYKAMEEATEYEKTAYKQLEQAKQETREILQAINKYLVGTRGIYTVKTFRNCRFEDILLVRADDLETLVNKLAKEHDVELEN